MTVLLLFGAGASNGSLEVNEPTPLGFELFGKLCITYPTTWGAIPSHLAEIFSNDFEEGMDALRRQETKKIIPLLREMAIYFGQFTINRPKANLYSRLVKRYRKRILSGDIILSTLNYECLIEQALAHAGINTIYTGDSHGGRLLKPHGSCNFIPQNVFGNIGEFTIDFAPGAVGNFKLKTVPANKVKEALENVPYPVCMSLYTKDKPDIISPHIIQEIRAQLQESIRQAKIIISVGVRPNPDDIHIWEPILQSQARVCLIGDETQCHDWISQYRKSNAHFIGEKFVPSFDGICKEIGKP